ncbi:sensor histidine kinase [Anaerosacchariphilus polymeriproducens]|uniref:GHKL domain-containing protein n=1 Tax=Anaerosacchariphilus polymeriproducens TaxID=1812858 RepID=A0A371AYJ4_9FIRM|nr:GHKL domain-containing protein [Anaerosacchariphilus polymeriproducens]RDU24637.1 GHKL domain-containing protein [Anaerosacchariphilus polymeriproducens]
MNLLISLLSLTSSVLSYYICILNLSLFTYTFKNKFYIFLLILLNAIIATKLGNIVIISLLLSLILYHIFFIKNTIKNFFIIPAAYIINVQLSNLCTHIIQNLFNVSLSRADTIILRYYLIYCISIIIISAIFSYFVGKLIRYYMRKLNTSIFRKEAWILILSHLSICALIYAFNIIWGQKVGYTDENTTFNSILFLLYFLSSTIILIITFRTYSEKSKLALKETEFKNLKEYTSNIETMYSNLRTFKHDYINVLSSLYGYIESKDYNGLETYFNEKILPTKEQITVNNERLSQLGKIEIPALKGLLSSKFIYAYELGIQVFIDISEPIENISMDIVDLSRILGIFLDNAIEGSLETKLPQLNFSIIKTETSIAVIITNNFINHQISLTQINQISVSTKGSNRGLGLYNVKQILKTYKNVLHETSMPNDLFIQHLEIMNL